jgi:hypothetical protein
VPPVVRWLHQRRRPAPGCLRCPRSLVAAKRGGEGWHWTALRTPWEHSHHQCRRAVCQREITVPIVAVTVFWPCVQIHCGSDRKWRLLVPRLTQPLAGHTGLGQQTVGGP